MLRSLKLFSWVGALALLACGLQQPAAGFVLLGPPPASTPGADQWQTPDIGYFVPGRAELGGPKSLGEEYRRNTPVLYYTYDANFLDYFGDGATLSVDAAFGVFNNFFNTYTNLDMLSRDLSEIPTETMRVNYKAQALGILDMKSATMSLLMENLGLGTPLRYTWNLHDRFLPSGGTCPLSMEYLVMLRNYDPTISTTIDQLKTSPYVNGVLYSYQIREFCSTPPAPLALSEALEFPVDIGQLNSHLPVSSGGTGAGGFYTGLTLDDIGGLRYLMASMNMNTETTGPNTTALVTNGTPQLFFTSNLNLLASQALTNNAAALQALFPGLIISGSSNFFGTIAITNTTAYFTNFPWDPVGTPAHLAFASSVSYTVIPMFQHTFANVFVISNSPFGYVGAPLTTLPPGGQGTGTLLTTSIGVANNPWGPVGSTTITTNSSSAPVVLTNFLSGEYILLQSNICALGALIPALTNVVAVTNNLLSTTNTAASTNTSGTQLSFSEDLITFYTNHVFVTFPVLCQGSNVTLLQGVQKIVFIRRDYDSLLTRFFYPITNSYVMYSITNRSILPQIVRRTVTSPDILITAADLSPGPNSDLFVNAVGRNINFNPNFRNPNLAGPGTIETPTAFTFNKASPIYWNTGLTSTNAWLTEITQQPFVIWGSFDGSTNPPVIYPTDYSIDALENQVLVQISPLYLADGRVGQAYSAQVRATSSTPNWGPAQSWSLTPKSPGLPPGLSISTSNGAAVISGTPTRDGFFDFSVRGTDTQGRIVDHSFSINVSL